MVGDDAGADGQDAGDGLERARGAHRVASMDLIPFTRIWLARGPKTLLMAAVSSLSLRASLSHAR
jgi:hypothetical protein